MILLLGKLSVCLYFLLRSSLIVKFIVQLYILYRACVVLSQLSNNQISKVIANELFIWCVEKETDVTSVYVKTEYWQIYHHQVFSFMSYIDLVWASKITYLLGSSCN